MSGDEPYPNEPMSRRPKSEQEIIALNVTEVRSLLQIQHEFMEAVFKKLETIEKAVPTRAEIPKNPVVVPEEDRGIDLSDAERLKAADLRTALLIGKVPDTAGLLIDTKTTAKLLNVSQRTLSRLHDLQAIPSPVRIGGTIIRWRLAELLAWMDAGCPFRKTWQYPERTDRPKRR